MFIACAVVSILLAAGLLFSAISTFTRHESITASMKAVNVPDSWLPGLATLKTAGAVGLIAGLWVPLLGEAAAIGVALYFVGAVVFHLRAKEYQLAPAVFFFVLAVASFVLRVASA
ncbi:DoxX family protein [Streptomyces sp. NPDC088725]|uniref:DoxX family protein n=1 Tax=Streptomyces sp. NPDC088725 TaxID=3365873 RepID=UPI003817B64D